MHRMAELGRLVARRRKDIERSFRGHTNPAGLLLEQLSRTSRPGLGELVDDHERRDPRRRTAVDDGRSLRRQPSDRSRRRRDGELPITPKSILSGRAAHIHEASVAARRKHAAEHPKRSEVDGPHALLNVHHRRPWPDHRVVHDVTRCRRDRPERVAQRLTTCRRALGLARPHRPARRIVGHPTAPRCTGSRPPTHYGKNDRSRTRDASP